MKVKQAEPWDADATGQDIIELKDGGLLTITHYQLPITNYPLPVPIGLE